MSNPSCLRTVGTMQLYSRTQAKLILTEAVNAETLRPLEVMLKDVLVEYVHATRRRVSAFPIKASHASEIASAIASRVMP